MHVRIGLDVGGVIIDRIKNDNTDTSFRSDNFLRTTAVPGAFEAIRAITSAFGPQNVFIISKVKSDAKTRLWLGHNSFYERTRFRPENLRFCRERYEKGPIADSLPGGPLTHFADDRADVLRHMPHVGTRYLFGPQEQPELVSTDGLVPVLTWATVLQHLGLAA